MFSQSSGVIVPRHLKDDFFDLAGVFRPTFQLGDLRVTPMGEPRRPLPIQTIRSFRAVISSNGEDIIQMPKLRGASLGMIGDPMLMSFKKARTNEDGHTGNAHVMGPVLLNWLEEMADTDQLLGLHLYGLRTIWEVIRLVPTQKTPSAALTSIIELLLAEGLANRN